jgi:DNA-binding NtrC family response regulator
MKNEKVVQTGRILVVDDEIEIRLVSAAVLSRSGYQTETAEDGAAAWEALQSNCFDLLITDHNMPKISGVELVKKLRSAHMTMPVILASGVMPTEELERNPWLQPVATLEKPFSSGQLLATVNEALAQAKSDAPAPESTFLQ